MPLVVHGLREASAAFAKADKDARKVWRTHMRQVAEPVRLDAEGSTKQQIPRIGPRWYKMRVGVTRTEVYVAPRQRGIRTRGTDPRRRPNLAGLMMSRAMEPALERHEPEIERAFERMLDEVADHFNHGSHV